MEETNKPDMVDYYIYESSMARAERHVRRWMIAFVFAFISLIVTNIGWVIYEMQYEDISTTVTQETSAEGGGNAIINGDNAGAVINGKSETDGNN